MSNQGPNAGGTFTNDATVGTVTWVNPSNASIQDASFATASLSNLSKYLAVTNFGFSIPVGSTINGIVVQATVSHTTSTAVIDNSIKLIKGGVISGSNKADGASVWDSSEITKTWGSSVDLWGLSLTSSDINASDFGVGISASKATGKTRPTARVNFVSITVYYTSSNTTILQNIGLNYNIQQNIKNNESFNYNSCIQLSSSLKLNYNSTLSLLNSIKENYQSLQSINGQTKVDYETIIKLFNILKGNYDTYQSIYNLPKLDYNTMVLLVNNIKSNYEDLISINNKEIINYNILIKLSNILKIDYNSTICLINSIKYVYQTVQSIRNSEIVNYESSSTTQTFAAFANEKFNYDILKSIINISKDNYQSLSKLSNNEIENYETATKLSNIEKTNYESNKRIINNETIDYNSLKSFYNILQNNYNITHILSVNSSILYNTTVQNLANIQKFDYNIASSKNPIITIPFNSTKSIDNIDLMVYNTIEKVFGTNKFDYNSQINVSSAINQIVYSTLKDLFNRYIFGITSDGQVIVANPDTKNIFYLDMLDREWILDLLNNNRQIVIPDLEGQYILNSMNRQFILTPIERVFEL